MSSFTETHYESLLQIYCPKIEELLNPRDLVPYLPEWNPDIFRMSNVKKFLQGLQGKLRDEDGHRVFTEFLNALKAAGYTPLYKLLTGDGCHEYDEFKRLLRVLHAYIKDMLVINPPLLGALLAKDVISSEEKEEIYGLVEAGRHNIEATYALIRALPRRNERWPALFIEALNETGNANVIEVLFISGEPGEGEVQVADEDRLLQKVREMAPEIESIPMQEGRGDHQVENLHQLGFKEAETAIKMPVNDLNFGTAEKVSNRMPANDLNAPCEGAVGGNQDASELFLNVGFQSYPYHEEDNVDVATASGSGTGDLGEEPAERPLYTLSLRQYQKELAQPGLEGKNAIICAPTGSGKTRVALAIAKHHLEHAREKDRPCVIYVVNKVNLVQQQLNRFKPYLPETYNADGISGGKSDNLVSLGQKISVSKVIFLTAQVLLNALEADSTQNEGVMSISDVSLLIFDECQNCTKKHPYSIIMKHYLKAKLGNGIKSRLPQVIGLTASLGVGGAGSPDSAVNHVEEMCANLDAVELCVVKQNVQELLRHVAQPGIDLKTVRTRDMDPCKTVVCEHMEEIHKQIRDQPGVSKLSLEVGVAALAKHFEDVPRDFGGQIYTAWVARLEKIAPDVNNKGMRMRSMTYASFLKMYHEAINRNAQARMKDALEYLARKVEQLKGPSEDAVLKWLEKRYREIDRRLRPIMDLPAYENPLLKLLENKIKVYSASNTEESRGIIFVQTRAATGMLYDWMMEDEALRSFKPAVVTGTSEMTQVQQKEVLEKFDNGDCRCLIATSVVEEGLDIPQCNWVIKYNHTTNEIALVQAKGRARQKDSQYAVVATDVSGKVRKEQLNQIREIMMNSAALEVSQMPRHLLNVRITKIQQDQLNKHIMQAEELKKRPFVSDKYDLLCKKCRVFVMNSADLRIRKTHVTSIREGLEDLYVQKPCRKPIECYDFETHHNIHCKDKDCDTCWGKMAKLRGIELPLFAAEGFAFRLRATGQFDTKIKKWKTFPYTLPEY